MGQARPGRAVRILAVHARSSEAVIPCVGDATLRNRAIYQLRCQPEVMINLKTADALGITIRPQFDMFADEVIE